MERIAREKIPVVLAVQDTTSFNYDTHADMEGLGPINKRVDGAQGILLHDTMAYTTEGTALGLVDIQVWARDPKQFGKRAHVTSGPLSKKKVLNGSKAFKPRRACSASSARPPGWSVWETAKPMSTSCFCWRKVIRPTPSFWFEPKAIGA